jgi:hypothetical protein
VARTVVIFTTAVMLGGCTVVDGTMSALAFLVILAPVLRMLAEADRTEKKEARRSF